MNQFERLEQFAKLQKPPAVKFKDLEAAVNSQHQVQPAADEGARRLLPGDRLHRPHQHHPAVRQARTCSSSRRTGVPKAVVNIYARITSMSRRVVNVFEDVVTVDVPAGTAAAGGQGRVDLPEDRSRWRRGRTG